ncbi:ATP-NAD kinase [Haloarchaeobius sp. TZWWS8]|uniref:ATP-NAD kinase n=1 Tax=Haloarchaeobius sp. TZWWS8 TaxID=3446121 RepID=UPI003EB6AC18
MKRVAGDEESPPTVGVAGESGTDRVAQVESAIREAGGRPTVGDATELVESGCSFVVAVEEAAVLSLLRAGVDVPVLPVDAGGGVRSVPHGDVTEAIAAALAGDTSTDERQCFDVRVGGERHVALFDVTLVTTEPARISEYAVDSRGEHVARFRADGVVVATPTGSFGYAGAAGSPAIEPGTRTATVAPIAPFAIQPDHWVVKDDAVTLSVERDEGAVSLLVDDRTVHEIGPDVTVSLSPGRSLSLLCTPQSAGRW